jgi:hypothetical protein
MNMTKYAALGDYLRNQPGSEIPMTFGQIERVIGQKLPRSQYHRAWWSNNPSNNVMTKVWRDAGFVTEQVDIEARRLVFRRVRAAQRGVGHFEEGSMKGQAKFVSERHPLLGALKGLMRIAPGTDLTEPADPEWGEHA